MRIFFLTATCLLSLNLLGQCYWQQRVEYKMDVNMDHTVHKYTGHQVLTYFNNSPDALTKVFYHLYFNAFQPGSEMDVRSRTIEDPDPRVGSRIANLKPDEQGYLHIRNLTMDGRKLSFKENETILEVILDKPLAAGAKAVFELDFDGQVPIQIRRSGRMSAEGIDYSMSQWYPKMCEYDNNGWTPNPYVGREFYGIWGDFEVNITIDKKYILGGTGILQNPNEIGYGYAEDEAKVKRPNTDKLTWKFKAQNVHDFMWAADPDYVHTKLKLESGTVLHFLYQNDPAYAENWKTAQELIGKGFQYLSEHFGQYPYPQYSIVQGGDGGMEYPMATLVTGNRKAPSLVGVSLHEAAHSWYQGVLATNESLYAWMDEGFTSYASSDAMSFLYANRMPGDHHNAHQGYIELANSGKEEGLDIHADHFITNNAYGSAAYNKGEVYLDQLNYICGEAAVSRALLSYYDKWKFKHPTANIFLHEMELQSGMVLDWYNEYFVNTTKTIDYGINEVRGTEKNTSVVLAKKGLMPMPIEMEVVYKDGTREMFYIPLDLMRGEKQQEGYKGTWTLMADWNWVNEFYYVTISSPASNIESISIDPSEKMADVKRDNNKVFLDEGLMFLLDNK